MFKKIEEGKLSLEQANVIQANYKGAKIIHDVDGTFAVKVPVTSEEVSEAKTLWLRRFNENLRVLLHNFGLSTIIQNGRDCEFRDEIHKMINTDFPPSSMEDIFNPPVVTKYIHMDKGSMRDNANRYMRSQGVKFQPYERRIETPEERQKRMDMKFKDY